MSATTNEITTDAARIGELLLINLFAVVSESDPKRRLKVIEANYTKDVIWATWPSSMECLSSRPQLPASTWRWCATGGSPCSTPS
jgi:hypothetical protein